MTRKKLDLYTVFEMVEQIVDHTDKHEYYAVGFKNCRQRSITPKSAARLFASAELALLAVLHIARYSSIFICLDDVFSPWPLICVKWKMYFLIKK